MQVRTFYSGNLPHIHPPDTQFFITFILKDALPKKVFQKLVEERDLLLRKYRNENKSFEKYSEYKYKLEKKVFDKIDTLLAKSKTGKHYLKDEKVAAIIKQKIEQYNGKRYKLLAYCIMSNHVHLLFDTTGFSEVVEETNTKGKTHKYPVADTMKRIKGGSAHEINKLLKLEGQFWQHESYDHYVRDQKELIRIANYIVLNPVKAGLIDDWRKWEHTFIEYNLEAEV